MKIKSILLTILIISCTQFNAQDYVAMFKGNNGKWGYINDKGEVLVKPKFALVYPFRNGIAKIDKTSFINIKGEKLNIRHLNIKAAHECREGLVAVRVGGDKWGFMNTLGEMVIPAIYNRITEFSDGYATVENKEGLFIVDTLGNLKKISFEKGKFTKKGKLSFIKKFHEGLAVLVFDEQYGPNTEQKFGHINTKGEVIIEPKNASVGHFYGGMGRFRSVDNLKVGYFNTKGEVIVEPQYVRGGHFFGELAWVKNEEGKIGFINKSGKVVIEPKYKTVGNFKPISGMAQVKDEEGWDYINTKGEPLGLRGFQTYKEFSEGLALLKQNGIWGYIDRTGNWVIEAKYKGATSFENGYARIKEKGKWGVINKKGEIVIEPIYKNIKEFYPIN